MKSTFCLKHFNLKVQVIRWKESYSIPEIQRDDFKEMILSVNNSKGDIPFLTHEEKAQ